MTPIYSKLVTKYYASNIRLRITPLSLVSHVARGITSYNMKRKNIKSTELDNEHEHIIMKRLKWTTK